MLLNNKWQYYHIETTTSTNDWLIEQYAIDKSISHAVVTASYQTKGKGVGNNRWHSKKGQNLLFSMAISTGLHGSDQFMINMVTSLALLDVIRHYLPDQSVHIKWPNDLWVDGEKMAGILTSHMISGAMIELSIIGIGLNINEIKFPKWLPNPTSMRIKGKKRYELEQILSGYLQYFDQRLAMLNTADGQRMLKLDFCKSMLYFGEWKMYTIHNETIIAQITDVNHFGQLLLKDSNNKQIICNLKEIIFPLR